MSDFFESPILNSPYEMPTRHWQLDEKGQPTNIVENGRRIASYVTPVARVKKTTKQDYAEQQLFEFNDTIKDDGDSQESQFQKFWLLIVKNSFFMCQSRFDTFFTAFS